MTTLEQRIIEACWDLAYTQAINPGERDGVGFNNADFVLGFHLASLGDVEGAASLLLLYPRQSPIAADELRAWLPEGERSFPRQLARGVLTVKRAAIRGRLGWAEGESEVVFIGLGTPGPVLRALRAVGTHTPSGWSVPKGRLARLIPLLASVENKPELLAIAAEHSPLDDGVGAVATQTAGRRADTVTIAIKAQTKTAVTLDWTGPFTEDGKAVRGLVKQFGGRFDGARSAWAVPMVAMGSLARSVASLLTVDAAALDPYLDLEDVDMTPRAIVLSTGRSLVSFTMSERCDGTYQAARALGARWSSGDRSLTLGLDVLGEFLTRCEEEAPEADLMALVLVWREHLAVAAAALEARQGVRAPETAPNGMSLFAHQREGIEFLLTAGYDDPSVKGAILADDMGLGKTVQTILAAQMRAPDGKVLVICPASLKGNWANEIRLWLGEGELIQILAGKTAAIDPAARWIIVNYDILVACKEQIAGAGFAIAVLDEAHYIKNRDAQRTKAIIGQTRKGKPPEVGILDAIPTVWLLTGTPILNRPEELWPLLRAIGHKLGENFWSFAIPYCDAHRTEYGWELRGASNLDELGVKMASTYLRRLKTKVLDLPPKIRQSVAVTLDPTARRAYEAGVKALLRRRKGEELAEGETNDHLLAELNALKMQTALAKIDTAIDMATQLVEAGGKVLIFTTYTEVLDRLQAHFGTACVRIDGGVDAGKRTAIVARFQTDPSVTVFLGNIQAAGVGITLTAAQDVLFVDMPWTPALLDQAEDRCYRIGQAGTVNVRYLEAEGTFDGALTKALTSKRATIQWFEDAAEGGQPTDAPKKARGVLANLMAELRKAERKAGKLAGAAIA